MLSLDGDDFEASLPNPLIDKPICPEVYQSRYSLLCRARDEKDFNSHTAEICTES